MPCNLIYPKTRLNLNLKVIVYCYDKVEDLTTHLFWRSISKFTKLPRHPSFCAIIDSKCYLNRAFTRRIIRHVEWMNLQLQSPMSASKLQLQPPTSKCTLTGWRLRAVTHECQILRVTIRFRRLLRHTYYHQQSSGTRVESEHRIETAKDSRPRLSLASYFRGAVGPQSDWREIRSEEQ